MVPVRLIAIVILGSCALTLVACGGGGKKTAPPTNQPAAATATAALATPSGTATPAATEEPFQGGRDPVEAPAQAPGAPLLIDVRTGEHTGYDRITFEFDGGARPAYRVEYITAPATGCASGQPAQIAGTALLQARFTPANAHNDQGTPTFSSAELTPGLPALLEAERTCDFEADVIWVLGLSQEVDFRVVELDNPPRIAVDVAHP